MSDQSQISWTDTTWNPVLGCSKASPGCKNCYAIREVHRMAHNPNPKIRAANEGLVTIDGKNWTGDMRLIQDRLELPLRWRKPRRVFVNSLSDLFHPRSPGMFAIFDVMKRSRRHQFQILTKHPDHAIWFFLRCNVEPLPNVWLGCSIENDEWAKQRHGPMSSIASRGWNTWVSYEPALGPIDWVNWHFLKWVVSGGESGPGARPSHPDWHRAARDFCASQGIPYFLKQAGVHLGREWGCKQRAGADPLEWPSEFQVQEFPL